MAITSQLQISKNSGFTGSNVVVDKTGGSNGSISVTDSDFTGEVPRGVTLYSRMRYSDDTTGGGALVVGVL